MPDQVIIVGLTALGCLVVGGLGLLALRRLARRSLRTQLVVAVAIPVLALAASVLINVRLMFLSTHDSGVALIALGTAVVLSCVAMALVLRAVKQGSDVLGRDVASLLADQSRSAAPQPADSPVMMPELERVHRELGEARQTLAVSRERERRAERARHELVSFMSHDLRTPLAGMRAVVEGLEDGVISDVPRAHEQLRSMVARMSGLVEDLFELSRVEAAPVVVRAPVALAELVADVADELSATAVAAGVALIVDLPDGDRLPVTGDADDLARALANLVSNALRHTERGGSVRLAAGRQLDGRLQVSVTDGCGGIPEEHLPRVFETGWRSSPARSADGGDESVGGGLGLAIARTVIASHDGSVAVSNVEGGCRFELELPAR